MAGRKIKFTVDFDFNLQDAKTQLDKLKQSLKQVKLSPANTSKAFTAELQQASKAAATLEHHLNKATNVNTGKLDLSKFSISLKSSGQSVQSLGKELLKSGKAGQEAFLGLANAVVNAEKPVRRMDLMMSKLGKTLMNNVRWQISSSIIQGFTSTLHSAISFSEDLNKNLNDIRIVTGDSVEDMDRFAESANRTAKALHSTTNELTQANLIYRQQGDNMELAMKKAEITTKAANIAFDTSSKEMSEYLTAIWNSYRVGEKSLELFVDKLAKIGATTATDMGEIATAMQKVAATANAVGVSYDQLLSTVATVSSATRLSAETVGTAFKTIYARMGDLKLDGSIVEDGLTVKLGTISNTLKQVGINILDSNNNMKDMGLVVEEVGSKWSTLTKAEQAALAEALAGKRQYTQLFALFENWDKYKDTLQDAVSAQGELNKEQDIYAQGWEGASKRLKASVESLTMDAINDEGIIDLLHGLSSVVDGIDAVMDGFGGFGNMLLGFGGLAIQYFSKPISESLTRTSLNLKDFFFGGHYESNRVTESVKNMMKELQTDPEFKLNDHLKTSLQYLDSVIEKMQEINRLAKDDPSEAERQRSILKTGAQNAMVGFGVLGTEIEQADESAEEARKGFKKGLSKAQRSNMKKTINVSENLTDIKDDTKKKHLDKISAQGFDSTSMTPEDIMKYLSSQGSGFSGIKEGHKPNVNSQLSQMAIDTIGITKDESQISNFSDTIKAGKASYDIKSLMQEQLQLNLDRINQVGNPPINEVDSSLVSETATESTDISTSSSEAEAKTSEETIDSESKSKTKKTSSKKKNPEEKKKNTETKKKNKAIKDEEKAVDKLDKKKKKGILDFIKNLRKENAAHKDNIKEIEEETAVTEERTVVDDKQAESRTAQNVELLTQMTGIVMQGMAASNAIDNMFATFEDGEATATDVIMSVVSTLVSVIPVIVNVVKTLKLVLKTGEKAWQGFWSAATMGIGAIIAAIMGIVELIAGFADMFSDDPSEQVAAATEKYEQSKKRLEAINEELVKIQENIDEINKKGALTLVDQQQLKELRRVEAQKKAEKAAAEAQVKTDAAAMEAAGQGGYKEWLREKNDWYETGDMSESSMLYQTEFNTEFRQKYQSGEYGNADAQVAWMQYIAEKNEEYTKKAIRAKEIGDTDAASLYEDKAEDLQQEQDVIAEELEELGYDAKNNKYNKDLSKDAMQNQIALIARNAKISEAIRSNEVGAVADAVNTILAQEFSAEGDILREQILAAEDRGEDMSKFSLDLSEISSSSKEDIKDTLVRLGVLQPNASEEEMLKVLNENFAGNYILAETAPKAFDRFSDSVNQLVDSMNTLSESLSEFSEKGYFSFENLNELLSSGQLSQTDYYAYISGLKSDMDIIQSLTEQAYNNITGMSQEAIAGAEYALDTTTKSFSTMFGTVVKDDNIQNRAKLITKHIVSEQGEAQNTFIKQWEEAYRLTATSSEKYKNIINHLAEGQKMVEMGTLSIDGSEGLVTKKRADGTSQFTGTYINDKGEEINMLAEMFDAAMEAGKSAEEAREMAAKQFENMVNTAKETAIATIDNSIQYYQGVLDHINRDFLEKSKELQESLDDAIENLNELWDEEYLARLEEKAQKHQDILDRFESDITRLNDFAVSLSHTLDTTFKTNLFQKEGNVLKKQQKELQDQWDYWSNIVPRNADELELQHERMVEIRESMMENTKAIAENDLNWGMSIVDNLNWIGEATIDEQLEQISTLTDLIENLNGNSYVSETTIRAQQALLMSQSKYSTANQYDRVQKKEKEVEEIVKIEEEAQEEISRILKDARNQRSKEDAEDREKAREDAKKAIDDIKDSINSLEIEAQAAIKSIQNKIDELNQQKVNIPVNFDVGDVPDVVELMRQKNKYIVDKIEGYASQDQQAGLLAGGVGQGVTSVGVEQQDGHYIVKGWGNGYANFTAPITATRGATQNDFTVWTTPSGEEWMFPKEWFGDLTNITKNQTVTAVRINSSSSSASTWKFGRVSKDSNGTFKFFAQGSESTPAGKAFVGELGQELAILPDGTPVILGKNGIEVANLPAGTQILTAEETDKVLSNVKDLTAVTNNTNIPSTSSKKKERTSQKQEVEKTQSFKKLEDKVSQENEIEEKGQKESLKVLDQFSKDKQDIEQSMHEESLKGTKDNLDETEKVVQSSSDKVKDIVNSTKTILPKTNDINFKKSLDEAVKYWNENFLQKITIKTIEIADENFLENTKTVLKDYGEKHELDLDWFDTGGGYLSDPELYKGYSKLFGNSPFSITSYYGPRTDPITGASKMHNGMDFSAAMNTPVYAFKSGEVINVIGEKDSGGYGNLIILKHDNGYTTYYAHLNKGSVKVGQKINQGQQIGLVGSTGKSTGPHLHFEARKNGVAINPAALIGYADGGLTQDETAWVGEIGPELLIHPDGHIEVIGKNGIELAHLPKGAQIISNKDTNKLLRNPVNYRGYAGGTKDDVTQEDVSKEIERLIEEWNPQDTSGEPFQYYFISTKEEHYAGFDERRQYANLIARYLLETKFRPGSHIYARNHDFYDEVKDLVDRNEFKIPDDARYPLSTIIAGIKTSDNSNMHERNAENWNSMQNLTNVDARWYDNFTVKKALDNMNARQRIYGKVLDAVNVMATNDGLDQRPYNDGKAGEFASKLQNLSPNSVLRQGWENSNSQPSQPVPSSPSPPSPPDTAEKEKREEELQKQKEEEEKQRQEEERLAQLKEQRKKNWDFSYFENGKRFFSVDNQKRFSKVASSPDPAEFLQVVDDFAFDLGATGDTIEAISTMFNQMFGTDITDTYDEDMAKTIKTVLNKPDDWNQVFTTTDLLNIFASKDSIIHDLPKYDIEVFQDKMMQQTEEINDEYRKGLELASQQREEDKEKFGEQKANKIYSDKLNELKQSQIEKTRPILEAHIEEVQNAMNWLEEMGLTDLEIYQNLSEYLQTLADNSKTLDTDLKESYEYNIKPIDEIKKDYTFEGGLFTSAFETEKFQKMVDSGVYSEKELKNQSQIIFNTLKSDANNVVNEIDRIYKKQNEHLQYREKQLQNQLNLLKEQNSIMNTIEDTQYEINQMMAEQRLSEKYLSEEGRKQLISTEAYYDAMQKISQIEGQIASATMETKQKIGRLDKDNQWRAEGILALYKQQTEEARKKVEVLKAEMQIQSKVNALNSALQEQNVRVFTGGRWVQMANRQNVQNAQKALDDAQHNLYTKQRDLTQNQDYNELEASMRSLKDAQTANTEQIKQLKEQIENIFNPLKDINELLEGFDEVLIQAEDFKKNNMYYDINPETTPEDTLSMKQREQKRLEQWSSFTQSDSGKTLLRIYDLYKNEPNLNYGQYYKKAINSWNELSEFDEGTDEYNLKKQEYEDYQRLLSLMRFNNYRTPNEDFFLSLSQQYVDAHNLLSEYNPGTEEFDNAYNQYSELASLLGVEDMLTTEDFASIVGTSGGEEDEGTGVLGEMSKNASSTIENANANTDRMVESQDQTTQAVKDLEMEVTQNVDMNIDAHADADDESVAEASPNVYFNGRQAKLKEDQKNARGTKDARAGISRINELGVEMLATTDGQFIELNPHEKIFNNDQMNYLFDLSRRRNEDYRDAAKSISYNSSEDILTIEHLSVALENVSNPQEFMIGLKNLKQQLKNNQYKDRRHSH